MNKPLLNYFALSFTGAYGTDENGRRYAIGQIQFGSDTLESIAAYLDTWTEANYLQQWRQGIGRIANQPSGTSCLIVSVQPDEYLRAIECWEMHREGGRVVFRYVIHAPGLAGKEDILDPHDIYEQISPLHDYEDAAEWHVEVDALMACLHRLSQ
jgi:hypothetical protein